MSTIQTGQFKNGMKILLDGDPWNIVETEFVKPGKGQAFVRARVKNLNTGRVVERTFKSNETVEGADVVETQMTVPLSRRRLLALHEPGDLRAGDAPPAPRSRTPRTGSRKRTAAPSPCGTASRSR